MTKSRNFFFAVGVIVVVACTSISRGQYRFSELRSRTSNPTAGFRNLNTFYGDGVNNLSGGSSAFGYRQHLQSPGTNLLSPSADYRGASRVGMSSGLNFANVGLSSIPQRGLGGGSQFSTGTSFVGGGAAQTLGMRTMPQVAGPELVMMPMFTDLNSVILLPEEPTLEDAYRQEWGASAQEAIKPFVEKKLQKPTLDTGTPSAAETAAIDAEGDPFANVVLRTEKLGLTTSQGGVYTAQQISLARSYVRQNKFDQALNCYQAARSVDLRNANALVGITLCHIMTGKLQAGGVNVKFLAEQSPNFWQETPDFQAVFGVPAAEIRKSISLVEPEIDQYLSLYQASDSRETAENLKLAYLSKMFLAWLKGDRAGMEAGIQAAVQATPLDAPVQQLCRGISGGEVKKELELQPLKPLE